MIRVILVSSLVYALMLALMFALMFASLYSANIAINGSIATARLEGITEGARQQALKRMSWKDCLMGDKK